MPPLTDRYRARRETLLVPLAGKLESYIRRTFADLPRIERISVRAKDVDRFMEKARRLEENGRKKYARPLKEIQDQLGARIIAYYLSDVSAVCDVVERFFRPIEERLVVPESEAEFGYFGKHYVLHLPVDVVEAVEGGREVSYFELQIKTLFQHAWSEANHDLGYKPMGGGLDSEQRRRIAFASAQAWGADQIFGELSRELGRKP